MRLKTGVRLLSLTAATLAIFGAAAPRAQAYDVDTHFYATYSMARYAGIRHEVAARIALGAQWMDESYLSDPTSMILLHPLAGVKKRRLLHFPSSRSLGTMTAQTQRRISGFESMGVVDKAMAEVLMFATSYKGDLNSLALKTETIEDHPFGHELFMEGLKAGNLQMASAGLHTLEDSFAHAGTPAEEGHVNFWHWPDRPFASPEKYLRMVKSVMKAMVAMRTLLPTEALDCTVRLAPLPANQPNCKMDAETLGANYGRTAAVVTAMSENFLKNPEYTKVAVRDFLQRAGEAKYILLSPGQIEKIVSQLPRDGKLDSYQLVEIVIKRLLKDQVEKKENQAIDIRFVLADMGRLHEGASASEISDYVDSFGSSEKALTNLNSEGVTNLVRAMAQQLLRWNVPAPLSDTHQIELEDDQSPIRAKEMDLRISAQRKLIRDLYGLDIEFIENNTKDEKGFYKEVMLNPEAEPKIPKRPGTYFATYSLREKALFNTTIFRYLFPSLGMKELRRLVARTADIKRMAQASWTLTPAIVGWARLKLKDVIPGFMADLVNERMSPLPDDLYYRNPRLFEKYRAEGKIKTLLTNQDVWRLNDLISEADSQGYHPR